MAAFLAKKPFPSELCTPNHFLHHHPLPLLRIHCSEGYQHDLMIPTGDCSANTRKLRDSTCEPSMYPIMSCHQHCKFKTLVLCLAITLGYPVLQSPPQHLYSRRHKRSPGKAVPSCQSHLSSLPSPVLSGISGSHLSLTALIFLPEDCQRIGLWASFRLKSSFQPLGPHTVQHLVRGH